MLLAEPVSRRLAVAVWPTRDPVGGAAALAGDRAGRRDWPCSAPACSTGCARSAPTLPAALPNALAAAAAGRWPEELGFGHALALLAALLFALRLIGVLVAVTVRTLRTRRRHRDLLDLLATPWPAVPGAHVLDHPVPVAYCLPGLRSRLVLSAGVLDALEPAAVAAVLAHERAHLRERHDLVVLPFVAWGATAPFVRGMVCAQLAVAALVEMRADDVATACTTRTQLTGALRSMGAAAPAAAVTSFSVALEHRLDRILAPPAPLPAAVRGLRPARRGGAGRGAGAGRPAGLSRPVRTAVVALSGRPAGAHRRPNPRRGRSVDRVPHDLPTSARPGTVGALRASGHTLRGVKDEMRDNLLAALRAGRDPWPGIVGFGSTVLPQLERALIAGHDVVLLGERGQGKTRLLRSIVNLLDEWTPVIAGSELGEHPYDPITPASRRRAAELGDELPVSWRHRDERYTEKLATPDTAVADLIGDVDPVKVAEGRSLGDPETIHYGLVPRAHRGIVAINELPDLAERIQVSLLNVMEERDIQVRGYTLRLPLDVLLVASANPEDYTNRGRIITPLKDRFGAEVRTHYPPELADEIALVEQEARARRRRAAAPAGDHRPVHPGACASRPRSTRGPGCRRGSRWPPRRRWPRPRCAGPR